MNASKRQGAIEPQRETYKIQERKSKDKKDKKGCC